MSRSPRGRHSPPGRFLEKRRLDFTKQTGAYVDPFFVPAFDREIRKSARLLAALLLVGAVIVRTLALWSPTEVNVWLASVPVAAAGLAMYPVVQLRSVDRVFRVPGSNKSVARPVRVALSDYVGGWLLALTWTAVAISVGLAAVLVALWTRGDASGALAAIAASDAATAVGLAGFTIWFGHALCDRPTPAVDASHLYLQDAWRAAILSRAHTNIGYICHLLFFGLLVSTSLPDWIIDTPFLLVVVAAISAWPLLQYVQPRQFRRRLWRSLLPGLVLLPGQPVPPRVGAGA